MSNHHRNHAFLPSGRFLLVACFVFAVTLFCAPVQSQDAHEYEPQFQKILYRETVTFSEISRPDANRWLTILFIESNPGYEVQAAYGWTGEKWKIIATAEFDRDFDAQRWNGKRFVPLAGDS
jgi:hypothetical protein